MKSGMELSPSNSWDADNNSVGVGWEKEEYVISYSYCFCDPTQSREEERKGNCEGNLFPIQCASCSCNQRDNQRTTMSTSIPAGGTTSKRAAALISQQRNNYGFIRKTMRGIPLWSTLVLIWMSLSVGVTEGLHCYECLSLFCNSGAVCDAIKSTMVEIFVPKRHFIHFDPTDICPENELPTNSPRWANLSRECERSDSICLVSPIEVHTVVDGKKNGKKLEDEYTLMTYGYLRGCASRRKLLEYPETINVRVEFAGRNESGSKLGSSHGTSSTSNSNSNSNNKNNNNNHKNSNGISNNIISNQNSNPAGTSSSSRGNNGGNENSHYGHGPGKNSEIFYNMTNMGNGAEFDPSKNKNQYKDGYQITKIYSHIFYIDQGAKNATRCYEDNCNVNAKYKFKINAATTRFKMLSLDNVVCCLSLVGVLTFANYLH